MAFFFKTYTFREEMAVSSRIMVTSREEMAISPRIMAIVRRKVAIVSETLYVLDFEVYFFRFILRC